MNLRHQFFRKKFNTTVVISHSSVIVYDTINDVFEAKLTLGLEKSLKSFYQILESRNDKKIRVILEPQGEIHKIITLPDLNTSKTYKKLKSMFEEMPYDIINYTTINKATHKKPEWKFLISGSYLNGTTKTLLNTLANHYHNNLEILAASVGYINTCFKLQKLILQRIKLPPKSYFLIYIRNSNNELCEFLFHDKKLIDIATIKTANSALAKTINVHFAKKKKRMLLDNIDVNHLFLVGLLPESLRANIAVGENRLFFSPGEVFYDLTKTVRPISASYSSTMFEINYINSHHNKSEILDIKSHTLLQFLKNLWSMIFVGIITTITISIFMLCIMYYQLYLTLNSSIKDLEDLELTQKKEFLYYQIKQESLEHNAQVKELYKIILSSHYSLETLSKISHANKHQLPIYRLVYNADANGGIDIMIVHNTQIKSFFDKLDHFIKDLSLSLPTQDILVHKISESNPNTHDQKRNIAIEIAIRERND